MSLTADPTVVPLPDPNTPSIFYYNTTLRSAPANDTLLDALSWGVRQGEAEQHVPIETVAGILLALLANSLIGISVILKKQSLKQLKDEGQTRASEGGFGYLKAARWWLGLLIMGAGESLNFVAYIFAPAILVTPLGVFSIVVTSSLSPYFLKEAVGILGRLGCLMIIIGCVIVTLCGPKDQEMASMDELEFYLLSPGFLIYTACVVVCTSVLMYLSPKYGAKYISINVFLVGGYSSLAIMFAKGLGIGIKTTIEGENSFARWSLWVCFFGLIHCLTIELIYSQRSLDMFNSSILMSIAYVVGTSLIILLSIVLFSNSRDIGWKDTILTISGFIVNIAALYIMNFERDPNLSLRKSSESIDDLEGKAIPPLEGTGLKKPSGDEHLYEIRRDSTTEEFSTPPTHTPKMTPLKMMPSMPSCTLPNITAAMFMENGESNSCLSLISETPSSKNNYSKERNSFESLSESNSQTSSNNGDHVQKLAVGRADDSSSSSSSSSSNTSGHSSCSSRRTGSGGARRRQGRPDKRTSCAADAGTCVCGTPLIADGEERSQSCPAHPLPDTHLAETPLAGTPLAATPLAGTPLAGTPLARLQSCHITDKTVVDSRGEEERGREGGEEAGFTIVLEVRPTSKSRTCVNNSPESIQEKV